MLNTDVFLVVPNVCPLIKNRHGVFLLFNSSPRKTVS